MSVRSIARSPASCSSAMYGQVPATHGYTVIVVRSSSRESPRSMITGCCQSLLSEFLEGGDVREVGMRPSVAVSVLRGRGDTLMLRDDLVLIAGMLRNQEMYDDIHVRSSLAGKIETATGASIRRPPP
jgi:hypothetical protein